MNYSLLLSFVLKDDWVIISVFIFQSVTGKVCLIKNYGSVDRYTPLLLHEITRGKIIILNYCLIDLLPFSLLIPEIKEIPYVTYQSKLCNLTPGGASPV